MLKISLRFKKFTNFTGYNSRILRIKNAKFSGYCFYINTNMLGDFQICIRVPLKIFFWETTHRSLLHKCHVEKILVFKTRRNKGKNCGIWLCNRCFIAQWSHFNTYFNTILLIKVRTNRFYNNYVIRFQWAKYAPKPRDMWINQ